MMLVKPSPFYSPSRRSDTENRNRLQFICFFFIFTKYKIFKRNSSPLIALTEIDPYPMKLLLTLTFGILISANLVGQAVDHPLPSQLLSGPMIGHTNSSMATIWVETDKPAEVKVHYWVEAGSQPIVQGVAQGQTNEEAPHVGTVKLENLPARGLVHYELEIDGQAVRPQTVQSFRLLPAMEATSSFSVAIGSCMNPINVPLQPIWTQVAIYRPDVLMLIGDNNYMPMRTSAYEAPESTVG